MSEFFFIIRHKTLDAYYVYFDIDEVKREFKNIKDWHKKYYEEK